jgi:glycine dehydrogenase subunit 1
MGATSAAEGVMMALAVSRGARRKVVISPAVHPQYRAVVRTYTQGMRLDITGDENLEATIPDLLKLLGDQTAAFVIQTPNFIGQIEDMQGLADAVHAAGALLIVVTNPITLGLLTPPVGIAVYIASNQSGVPVAEGFRKTAPFIVPLIVTLLLITYIPDIVLFLPRLLFR